MQSMESDEIGQKLTEDDPAYEPLILVFIVLENAYYGGFTTKSKFSREMADVIAIAATEGLITTRINQEQWGNVWYLTEDGYEYMKELEYVLDLEGEDTVS